MSKDFAILIIGHGSKYRPSSFLFEKLDEMLQSRGYTSTFCFMEFEEPSIEAGLERLIDGGAKKVVAVPIMLGGGAHVMQDIPILLENALSKVQEECEILYGYSIGPDSRIVDIIESRVEEALNGSFLKKFT